MRDSIRKCLACRLNLVLTMSSEGIFKFVTHYLTGRVYIHFIVNLKRAAVRS